MTWRRQNPAFDVSRFQALAEAGVEAAVRKLAAVPKVKATILPFLTAYNDLIAEAPEYSQRITWRSVADYSKDLGFSQEYMEMLFDVLQLAQNEVELGVEAAKPAPKPTAPPPSGLAGKPR